MHQLNDCLLLSDYFLPPVCLQMSTECFARASNQSLQCKTYWFGRCSIKSEAKRIINNIIFASIEGFTANFD